MISQKMWKL